MAMDETIKNKAEEFGGKAKEMAGDVTGDRDLQSEGVHDQASGQAKETANQLGEKLDNAREAVTDVAEDLGAKVKGAVDGLKDAFGGKDN
ncbi:MAG: CsbD family protein [Mobiluncus porci]|uniref:CsbD family protein n=1 Tax=Mobiluncus porci TaxID=2652278 RepID=A0A7K0K1R3_9ACTO|nr:MULTISPECIES: CsbD family protein [Mobiluncus]MCI6584831.1 CsbD family protein [Mobiluncus sp.]MDD7541705.1 CsbD family protein [Mobiluncus porci]MDY5749276.1 CsbD family protein [Mobiluncus porci]MST49412.1 CsbD family protein [Mobiluncus porci]